MHFHYRDIQRHKKTCVRLRTLFVCKFCNDSKTNMNKLNHHIHDVHTKDKMKLKCYFCRLKVPTDRITTNLASHTKERLHKCRYCQAYFATGRNLQKHIGVRHDENDDTKEGGILRQKMQTKCAFCQRYFAYKGYPTKNLFVHTKETR